jgi:ribonuclease BN (tRNA processing enzyme)
MEITFAGVGSAFTDQRYYQSNMLITAKSGKKLLIDCGGDARFSLGELGITNYNVGEMIDAVYVSHLHADHIGGMEWIGFCTYFNPKSKRPTLFIVNALVKDLWRSLQGGMRSHEGVVLSLKSFFDVRPIPINDHFEWEAIKFTPIQTIHIMDGMRIVPSFGLLVEEDKGDMIFITTDTQYAPRQIERFYDKAKVIFHDCETANYRSGVHAHYDDMKMLPNETKSKIWLYHYNPDPPQDAVKDGFLGFVQKGQVFKF